MNQKDWHFSLTAAVVLDKTSLMIVTALLLPSHTLFLTFIPKKKSFNVNIYVANDHPHVFRYCPRSVWSCFFF